VTSTFPEADVAASASLPERRTPVMFVVVLGLVLVLLAVAALIGALKLRDTARRDDARAAALGAARQEALNLTSIDMRDVDGDVKRVLDGATGTFAKDVQQQSAQIKSVVVANQAVSEVSVVDAALVRCDLQTATALVVISGTLKNKAAPSGRPNSYRMQLDLERHGTRWLTSALQFVG
jgi:Mce-associated membrane protein